MVMLEQLKFLAVSCDFDRPLFTNNKPMETSTLDSRRQLTTLGHLRTRGAEPRTRDAQDSRCSSTEPVAHEQIDPLYDLQHVESSLVWKRNENQSTK